jgi:hypothetical protein
MPSRYRKKPLAQLEHGTRIYAPSPQARRGAEAAGRFGIHVGEVATDWSTLQAMPMAMSTAATPLVAGHDG